MLQENTVVLRCCSNVITFMIEQYPMLKATNGFEENQARETSTLNG
jgi:hypothetical protein